MTQTTDAERLALILNAKDSFRAAQRLRTWEQRIASMARMNLATKAVNKKLSSGESVAALTDQITEQSK
jgi:hypothetical protein